MAIALAQMALLVEDHYFEWSNLIEDINDYTPELRSLEKSGTIVKVRKGDRQIKQRALLWWLADEVKRMVRDETTFEGWLEEQEFEGIFTQKEKRSLGQIANELAGFLGEGATTLIGAFAKGVGEGLGESAIRF
jgi:hypothetical protein